MSKTQTRKAKSGPKIEQDLVETERHLDTLGNNLNQIVRAFQSGDFVHAETMLEAAQRNHEMTLQDVQYVRESVQEMHYEQELILDQLGQVSSERDEAVADLQSAYLEGYSDGANEMLLTPIDEFEGEAPPVIEKWEAWERWHQGASEHDIDLWFAAQDPDTQARYLEWAK